MNEFKFPPAVLFSSQNAGDPFSDYEWQLVEATLCLEGDLDTFVPSNVEKALEERGIGENSYIVRHGPDKSSDKHELIAFALFIRSSSGDGWMLFASWTWRNDDDTSFVLDRAEILRRGEATIRARNNAVRSWLKGWRPLAVRPPL